MECLAVRCRRFSLARKRLEVVAEIRCRNSVLAGRVGCWTCVSPESRWPFEYDGALRYDKWEMSVQWTSCELKSRVSSDLCGTDSQPPRRPGWEV